MKQIDIALSRTLAQRLRAEPGDCFATAYLAVMSNFVSGDLNPVYVEGYAANALPVPMLHGWIETDKLIIDPTWVTINQLVGSRADWYVAARRWTAAQLPRPTSVADVNLPLVGFTDWREPAYIAANRALSTALYGRTFDEMCAKFLDQDAMQDTQ